MRRTSPCFISKSAFLGWAQFRASLYRTGFEKQKVLGSSPGCRVLLWCPWARYQTPKWYELATCPGLYHVFACNHLGAARKIAVKKKNKVLLKLCRDINRPRRAAEVSTTFLLFLLLHLFTSFVSCPPGREASPPPPPLPRQQLCFWMGGKQMSPNIWVENFRELSSRWSVHTHARVHANTQHGFEMEMCQSENRRTLGMENSHWK